MNIFLYIIIFIIGITFSYLFLGRNYKKNEQNKPNEQNKQKIKPTHFILEILSGLLLVLIAYSLKINVYDLKLDSVIKFVFIILYLVIIFLIAYIDKKHRKIEKSVLCYGIMVSCFYIIYLCIMSQNNIYRYVMYLVTLIILLIIDNIKQLKEAKESYFLGVLMLIVIMLINTDIIVTSATIIIVLFAVAITRIIYYTKNALNKYKKENKDMTELYKFGYLLSIANVILFIGSLYLMYN